nr:MAG TPA: hypothetical protein [Caudoviricetes sp.]
MILDIYYNIVYYNRCKEELSLQSDYIKEILK